MHPAKLPWPFSHKCSHKCSQQCSQQGSCNQALQNSESVFVQWTWHYGRNIAEMLLYRYMRIYNVAIRDRALVYAWFFLMFGVHIAFCIWSAISPPLPFINDWSHTGFVTCIKAFDKNTFVGVVYVIGGALWSIESLWSIWAIKTVSEVSLCWSATLYPLPLSR